MRRCIALSTRVKTRPHETSDNLVVNLSQYKLEDAEKRVLSLGLNYAVPHKTLPLKDIFASTEQTSRSLKPSIAQQLREGVKSCVQHYKPSQSNLDREQRLALSKLKKNDSIIILPADKGNATVVMDRDSYKEKINDLLDDDETYTKLKRDPTKKIERSICERLKSAERNGTEADKCTFPC